MVSLQRPLASLLASLPPSGPSPIDEDELYRLVRKTLEDTRDLTSPENRKSQWEFLLKNELFNLAAQEGKALAQNDQAYYYRLRDHLDLVLTFDEYGICEASFPFILLQDLLETQTIASCSHIFSWIELRAPRLTENMVPQKGKALVLLRTLNDLLRRLSKMGNMTIFCGRILTFLSRVFPLGERSGVNLRGEYGPTWEGVSTGKPKESVKAEVKVEEGTKQVKKEENATKVKEGTTQEDNAMQVDDSAESETDKKDDFYNTFWSLQLPFSKPWVFAQPTIFAQFQEAVNKILPVIKEATAKERAMMGSRAGAASGFSSLKRKRDSSEGEEESGVYEYFFAKFLTSPDLLELEIADTHFRRQILVQLLILLTHLLTFTKAAKATWQTIRNRSLQPDFTLEPEGQQWVQETVNKTLEELRQTTPNGRAFAETVGVVLERDKNWVKWKNELCAPFDKESWRQEVEFEEGGEKKKRKVGLEEATKETRAKMREPPKDWEWKYGSEALTEIWQMGYRNLDDLQQPFSAGEVKDFVKKVQLENRKIEMRTKTLRQQQERREALKAAAAAAAAPTPPSVSQAPAPGTDVEMKPADESPSLAAPAPSTEPKPDPESAASAPAHPSLPAKPGSSRPVSPSKALDQGTPTPSGPPATNVIPPSSTPTPAPATVVPPPLPPDEQITRAEESKQRWAWLALRAARDQYLMHFGKIGTGDIELLAQEIEKEKVAKELEKEKGTAGAALEDAAVGSASPVATFGRLPGEKLDTEGDVKMAER